MARIIPPRAPRGHGRPLVLAHRGASADAPENTLAAFAEARRQGADGFELDVWRCGTGEVVVHHDRDLRRTAGLTLRVDRAPWSALRDADVGAWKGARWRGERVPRLEDVLRAWPEPVVNVELKAQGVPDPRLAVAVARLLRAAGATGRCIVSSFAPTLLAVFRLAAPEVPAGLLVERGPAWAARARALCALLRASALHPARELVTAASARRWAGHGLAVNVWTVDGPDEARRLARLGAAALITNRPAAILEALGRPAGAAR